MASCTCQLLRNNVIQRGSWVAIVIVICYAGTLDLVAKSTLRSDTVSGVIKQARTISIAFGRDLDAHSVGSTWRTLLGSNSYIMSMYLSICICVFVILMFPVWRTLVAYQIPISCLSVNYQNTSDRKFPKKIFFYTNKSTKYVDNWSPMSYRHPAVYNSEPMLWWQPVIKYVNTSHRPSAFGRSTKFHDKAIIWFRLRLGIDTQCHKNTPSNEAAIVITHSSSQHISCSTETMAHHRHHHHNCDCCDKNEDVEGAFAVIECIFMIVREYMQKKHVEDVGQQEITTIKQIFLKIICCSVSAASKCAKKMLGRRGQRRGTERPPRLSTHLPSANLRLAY